MKLEKLPNWKKLSKKEQERIKKVFKPRIDSDYNIDGKLSTSKKELNKNG